MTGVTLAGLDQLLELEQVLPLRRLDERPKGLAHEAEHDHPGDQAAATGEPALVEPSAVRHEDAGRSQHAPEVGERMVRHVVEDQVVAPIASAEVFLLV